MKIVAAVLQLILFLAIFFVGSVILPGVGLLPPETIAVGTGRVFVADGVLMMIGAYLLILLIGLARKRLRASGGLTTLSFLLALILGLAMKFGFKTI